MRGHRDAQELKVCPLTVHTGWHLGQHSPSGTTSSSPPSQTGCGQKTAEQSGVSGTHFGQHSPSGTTSSSPFSQTGSRQEMAEQFGTHCGQHSPSGTTRTSPSLQTGSRQETVEQSGATVTATYKCTCS